MKGAPHSFELRWLPVPSAKDAKATPKEEEKSVKDAEQAVKDAEQAVKDAKAAKDPKVVPKPK